MLLGVKKAGEGRNGGEDHGDMRIVTMMRVMVYGVRVVMEGIVMMTVMMVVVMLVMVVIVMEQ